MRYANHGKGKTTNDGNNRNNKSSKNQNARRRKITSTWESYKYLGILEVDTIKHAEMNEKIKKNTSWEQENYSKPNFKAEISSKR